MRYDLSTPLLDLEGAPIPLGDGEKRFTLGIALERSALFADSAKPPTPAAKRLGFKLAKRIRHAGRFVELTAEEVVHLKGNIEVMWTPLLLGVLEELLESPIAALPAIDKPAADIPAEPKAS